MPKKRERPWLVPGANGNPEIAAGKRTEGGTKIKSALRNTGVGTIPALQRNVCRQATGDDNSGGQAVSDASSNYTSQIRQDSHGPECRGGPGREGRRSQIPGG